MTDEKYLKIECCFYCAKKEDCNRVCQFYKGILGNKGTICRDPERCIPCENVFEKEAI